MTMGATPLHVELEKDGALLRLRLSRPKANIVDAAMIAALRAALDEHLSGARLRAMLLEAEGPHFSFGASVEEHLPGSCAALSAEEEKERCCTPCWADFPAHLSPAGSSP